MNTQEQFLSTTESHPLIWGKYFCEKHFNRLKTPEFHVKLIEFVMRNVYSAIAAPRGFAKTTIAMFLYASWSIATKKKNFICLVSNTFGKAVLMLELIAEEMRTNSLLQMTYGIKLEKDSEGHKVFVHRDGTKICVMCYGNEQIPAMRGIRFGVYRPDLIIIDDLEDDTLCRSPERRKKLKEDFENALLPCVDINHQIIIIGTIIHDDALIADIVVKKLNSDFKTLFFQALIDEGESTERSLWEEKFTVEQLKKKRENNPIQFAKEYQNDPVSGGVEHFQKEDIRYWDINNGFYECYGDSGRIIAKGLLSDCKGAIACDLAWEEKKTSDYSVLLPGYLTPQGDYLLDTYICEKGLRPDMLEEYIFRMVDKVETVTGYMCPIGFEKAKLEKVMKWFLKQAMRRRNKTLVMKDIKWGGDKIERIVSKLQPLYKNHMIYHRRGFGEYETQLLRIPSGKHDDLPDAGQGLVQLLSNPRKSSTAPASEDTLKLLKKHSMKKETENKRLGNFKILSNNRDRSIKYTETIL